MQQHCWHGLRLLCTFSTHGLGLSSFINEDKPYSFKPLMLMLLAIPFLPQRMHACFFTGRKVTDGVWKSTVCMPTALSPECREAQQGFFFLRDILRDAYILQSFQSSHPEQCYKHHVCLT